MSDVTQISGRNGLRRNFRDNGDGTFAEEFGSQLRAWDATSLTWVKLLADHTTGALSTAGGGAGGGGAATIADGADVAQGATTDASSANTVVGILKAIKAAVTGSLTTTTSWASAQHVIVDTAPSTTVTGPLTDTQLRASAPAVDTEMPAAAALTDAVVNPTTPLVGSATMVWDSTLNAGSGGWLRAPGTVAAGLKIQSGQLPAALAANGGLKVEGVAGGVAQPVSLATNTPDVTDRAARLVGHVTVDNASLAVTMATQTPDVTDRAARLVGRVRLTDDTNLGTIKAASALAVAADTGLVVTHSPQRADASILCVTNTGAAAAAVTTSLPIPGAGLFHYIAFIQVVAFASALRVAAAAPVLVTTTNLPGAPVFSFQANAMAQGASEVQVVQPSTPIKSSVANTATTVVGPATTSVIWRITVWYYTAP